MKKVFISLTLIFCIVSFSSWQVFASDTTSTEKTFYISIYNNLNSNYIISNVKLTTSKELSVLDSIKELKELKSISGYEIAEGTIKRITLPDKQTFAIETNPYKVEFMLKRNGVPLSKEKFLEPIQNGDIIEWVYSTPVVINHESESSDLNNKVTGNNWTDKMTVVLNDACEWVNRNDQSSKFYLITLGIAGKTADSKQVNNLVSRIANNQVYDSPTDISRQIMATTFCGFDASATEYGQLLAKLANYKDIMKTGIFGAVNAIIAYDTNNYAVGSTTLNSRDNLIENILGYQQQDGGFSITKNSVSDIDTTAMTITALSTYRNRENVQTAIDKGFEFLVQNQTESGGFGFQGQENCESLSTIIIALNSAGLDINDERFLNNGRNLLDLLLEYKNSDGGFGHIIGDKSTAMPTEQAVIALTSIKKSSNPYKLTTPVSHFEDLPTKHLGFVPDNAPFLIVGAIVLAIVLISAILAHKVIDKRK